MVVNSSSEVDGMHDAGVALMRAFNYVIKQENPVKALSFLTDIYEKGEQVTSDLVVRALADKSDMELAKRVIGKDSQYDDTRQESVAFYERIGLGELPQVLINGVPLKKEQIRDEFEESVVGCIMRQTNELQKAVYNGFLQDSMDMLDYLMTRINVMPRLNPRVLGPPSLYLDLSAVIPPSSVMTPHKFLSLSPPKMSSAVAAAMKYITKKDEPSLRAITVWVVMDLDTPIGRTLLYNAMKHLKHSSSMRLGLVHCPGEDTPHGSLGKPISHVVQVALETLNGYMAKSFITKLLKEENVEDLQSGKKTLEDLTNMDIKSFSESLKSFTAEIIKSHSVFCSKVLGFKAGERGIITNGKVIGPLKSNEMFTEEDFNLLEKYMLTSTAGKIEKKIKTYGVDEDRGSELIMKVEALLTSIPQKEARKDVMFSLHEHSVLNIPPRTDGPAYEVVAILDPTTRAAQKYTPFIMVLQEVANVNITVFLNCREKLSEMPLKSYYRYVLDPEPDFNTDAAASLSGSFAQFLDMPEKPLLTLGMDPPESWLVQAVHSPYDLDNIFLEEVDSRVHADFELENLLLEGHCYDLLSGNPPRGLQFILGTNSTPATVDTIVMANLGYFQLKASPGVWQLHLRPGRSSELYNIASQDMTDSPPDSSEVIIVMDSFKSKIIRIKVTKKPGKENEDLLAEEDPNGKGLWDSISSSFTGGSRSGKEMEEEKETTLNIFSLASGHLYERLLRIMMLSVITNTKTKVKFWFLKNYLSPTFKEFIPHMAETYGFEYELVQYKWPRWLHQQTEKQRIIWGYKILFLDVLFPLNINKIIFVDADQTVRADLLELHDLDLEGAPYGYTPFCESRTDMDGYRFWKTGYWSNHLGYRKYHISALYVVDLKKFRKIAAGDRLRGQYQGLSQDPNSLSNLDQDLPNNMIHQVAIKSLPQEWLWCETWCSDSEKAVAKTIDLCNNPKTKEPKLQAAMRIVPEWNGYDQEIKKLWDKVYKNRTSTEKDSDEQQVTETDTTTEDTSKDSSKKKEEL